ncbi:phosphonate metabolism protein/1,5-bisphosphokinase (PRPP-forming) PhnN [Marinobacterium jannaschii]|uniref:phosphonate metabolism protein/1,5-bisphosphokinase (PRPP-forming) PhnN n=1 Tax=Marinobacterium jannaschii TaxID=64970 RepID=UPI000487898A|nr:phosphonate metabolism protein/1,5-bisphosphokinase (PRPP-forming) PhnN [Marinobacterium jannaschii]
MAENSTARRATKGTLIYVMGASGSGKDSLLRYARQAVNGGAQVMFAHRYITRSMHAGGENHVELSVEEFAYRLRHHCFSLHWKSHGLHYGIGCEVDAWLEHGLNVVVNGSRAHFEAACQRYPDLLPVLITVSEPVLKQRLLDRGRESIEEVEARLQRGQQYAPPAHPDLQRICNEAELTVAGEALLQLIRSLRSEE